MLSTTTVLIGETALNRNIVRDVKNLLKLAKDVLSVMISALTMKQRHASTETRNLIVVMVAHQKIHAD